MAYLRARQSEIALSVGENRLHIPVERNLCVPVEVLRRLQDNSNF